MNTVYKVILVALLVLGTYTQNANQCEALILSGGSDFGAYSGGVINSLIESGISWDVFSGISTSAVTAAVLNSFEKADITKAGEEVQKIWEELRLEHFSKPYPKGGMGYGLTYENGFISEQPLRKFLENNLNTDQKQKLTFGATNLDNGLFVRYNENNVTGNSLISALVAALAIPSYSPWHNFQNKNVFDGAVVNNFDFAGALERCQEITENENNIIFDVVSLFSLESLKSWGGSSPHKTFEVLRRNSIIRSYARFASEFTAFFESHPKIQCRYFVQPTTSLPEPAQPFYFKKSDITKQQNAGKEDGQNTIQNGEGSNCKQAMEEAQIYLFQEIDPSLTEEDIKQLLREISN